LKDPGARTDAQRPRVLIAGTRFGYPHGSGAAARVAAYAHGLQDAGAVVHVVSMLTPRPSGSDPNGMPRGVHEGVSYEYACGTRTRASSFIGRRWLEAKVPIGVWRAAHRLFRRGAGPKAIIIYTWTPWWIAFAAMAARFSNAVCLVEICEMPFVYEARASRRAFKSWLLHAFAYRLVDGFIVISTELETYVRRHAPEGKRVIRVPILVSVSDFERVGSRDPDATRRQIAYVGSFLDEYELTDLMGAFALVARKHPDVDLMLIGNATPKQRETLGTRAAELGIEGRVRLPGRVQRNHLPELLAQASALALLRRDAEFSRAGLPTKLAEYLASGRPVVVTAIGDIPRYLSDKVDAFLAPAGDLAAFAALLTYVLDHEAEAAAVGVRGRAVALRLFDRSANGARLVSFIEAVHRSRYASAVTTEMTTGD